MCRTVAAVEGGGTIEVWSDDGTAIRPYTCVRDLVDGIYLLMHSDLHGAANIGCPQYFTKATFALLKFFHIDKI